MKLNATYLAQLKLVDLGYKLTPDGIIGPITTAAIDDWAYHFRRKTDSAPTPTGTTPLSAMLTAAASKVGLRETSKNQGPGLEELWSATTYKTGYANREPYCAAFICWAVLQGYRSTSLQLPTTPLAYGFESWGKATTHVQVLTPGSPIRGDICTLRAASHVLLVESVKGTTMTTIEGNTDGSGSREGDGIYRRTRPISSIRKIIRITL